MFWRKAFLFFCVMSLASVNAAEAVVRASSFGYDRTDATRALQAAIDSGARQVIVDRQEGDWIVRPITIARSNLELILASNVVIRAKSGEFHGRNDCLIRVSGGSSEVTIRGEKGARLEMNRSDYANPDRYSYSQWRHALYIGRSRRVRVRDLELMGSGGDGVYISDAADVTLENLVSRENYRQGMSVISVAGLVVRNCRFVETSGTAPQCGVDFEPNRSQNRLVDVLFEDCLFNGNAASGVDLHLPKLVASSAPVSITFRRCTMRGNEVCGITTYASTDAGAVSGTVVFEDCQVEGNGRAALLMCNQCAAGIGFTFKNCLFDGRAGSNAAICLANSSIAEDFAGVAFENCRVRSDKSEFCTYGGLAGTGVTSVRGVLSVSTKGKTRDVDLASLAEKYPPDLELRRFSVAKVSYEKLVPACAAADVTRTPWLRRGFTFVQHVPGPGDYPIRLHIRSLKKGRQPNVSVQLRDRVGTDLGQRKVTEEEHEFVIHCQSAKGNVYRLEIQAGLGAIVQVESALTGNGILFDDPINLFKAPGSEFHFAVPADAAEVMVQVLPDEPVSAELRDPSGKAVASLEYGTNGGVLKVPRTPTKEREIWSVAFPEMKEDSKFRIGAPASPVASPVRAAVLW